MKRRGAWVRRLLVIALLAAGAWYFLHGPSIAPGSYLVMDVGGNYSEAQPVGPVARLFGQARSMTSLEETLRKVRHDGRIAGVVVRIGALRGGWAQAHEIRGALALVQAAGKRVVAEIDVELAPASKEIYIASVADAVYVAPGASPLMTGLEAHAVFLGGVWPKIDVNLQVEKIREYKSAGDELSRESMSPAHREMLDSILDDIHAHFVKTVAGARNLGAAELDQAIARGVGRGSELVEAGVANAVRGNAEILAELGSGNAVATIGDEDYAGVSASSLGIGDGPTIAVVHASGTVGQGRSRAGSGGFGSRTIADALAAAAADQGVAAIVLRVASPGGSPAASDEIWLAVREAAKKKPVIASLGDVAASGGYYLASAADRIVAAPGTLTGSIGVIFFKPDISGLLGRAGIHTETLQRGHFARILDLDRSLDDDDLALVRAQMSDIYRLFVERVATGRKRRPEDIDRVGGGRVWTGQQAFDRGLVDEIGTFDDAVRAAANAAGIHDSDKVQLVHYPKNAGLVEQLAEAGQMTGVAMEPPLLAHLAESLGGSAALLSAPPGILVLADGVPSVE